MNKKHDVVVIGAGPSGLNCARRMAQAGLSVAVLERKKEIGENVVCTGIIGKEAFDRFSLKTDSIMMSLKDVKLVSPYKTSLDYSHPEVFAYVVDRGKFDRNLAEDACQMGAEVVVDTLAQDIHVGHDSVKIPVDSGDKAQRTYQAEVAVLATGIDYRLQKKVGLGLPKNFMNGVQMECDVEHTQEPTLLVGKNLAPGAFAWSIPVNGKRVRVGLVTEKDPRTYFPRLLESLYPGEADKLTGKKVQYKAIAQGALSRTYGDRILAVGEAAGQVKTTTGGGVYYGLVCSDIAADTVLEAFASGSFDRYTLEDYEVRWKDAIHKELKIGYYTRKVCGKLGDLEVERLFQIAKSNGVFPLISKMGNFDWHGDLILQLTKKATIRSIQAIPDFIKSSKQ